MNRDSLPNWFDRIHEQYCNSRQNHSNKILSDILNEELAALHALFAGHASPQETALRITRPISTSPVPDTNSYNDDSIAVCTLFHILADALVHWPLDRRLELLTMLVAIGGVSDCLHNGESLGEDGEPVPWARFPWFHMVWFEAVDQLPGEAVMRVGGDPAEVEVARKFYIRRKEVEAQLFAIGVLKLRDRFVEFKVARTFEQEPDVIVASDEAAAYEQNRIEFEVPAIAVLVVEVGPELFRIVVQKEGGLKRWERWESRLREIIDDEKRQDETTRAAAQVAHEGMRSIRSRAWILWTTSCTRALGYNRQRPGG